MGAFTNGTLEFAQVASLKAVIDDERGIKVPIFTEPDGRLYKREIATYDFITSNPLLPDPYEAKMVECRSSRVSSGGDNKKSYLWYLCLKARQHRGILLKTQN